MNITGRRFMAVYALNARELCYLIEGVYPGQGFIFSCFKMKIINRFPFYFLPGMI
jgi:hypothetical protein